MRAFVLFVAAAAACSPADQPTSVTLEPTGCYGSCPRYKLSFYADGKLSYSGVGYQEYGTRRRLNDSAPEHADTVVTDAVIRAAFAAFESAWSRWQPNRFQLGKPTCPFAATDHPTAYVVRTWTDRSDTIEVYRGCSPLPARLVRLPRVLDSLAGVDRWLGPLPYPGPPANER